MRAKGAEIEKKKAVGAVKGKIEGSDFSINKRIRREKEG